MHLAIDFLTCTVFSIVTSRGYDDDATVHESAYGNAQRIKLVRVNCRHADAEIHYATLYVAALVINQLKAARTFDTVPVPLEFKTRRLRILARGAMPMYSPRRNDTVAGGCGSYVSSVTVWIVGSAFTSEILIDNDSGQTGFGVGERGMCAVNTGVNNRDSDSTSVQSTISAHRANVICAGGVCHVTTEGHDLTIE